MGDISIHQILQKTLSSSCRLIFYPKYLCKRRCNTAQAIRNNSPWDIDLYFMGLLSPKKVRPTFLIVTDSLPNDTVRDVKKEITIEDIIQRAGESRRPTYRKAQRDFTVTFVLLTEKGQSATPDQIEHMDWISRRAPKEWKKATRGLSTINRGKKK